MPTTTYSFQDLSGSFISPMGVYLFAGNLGVGEVNVEMDADRTFHDLAADGAVMVTMAPGPNGKISIQCQQTSDFHKWMLNLYNLLDQLGPASWAQSAIFLKNTLDGTQHIATGVSPQKLPAKPYQIQGQKVTWVWSAASIVSLAV